MTNPMAYIVALEDAVNEIAENENNKFTRADCEIKVGFEGSFGSEGVDLGLSVGGFLLELSQSLDLSFLLLFDPLRLHLGVEFLLVASSLVGNDLLLMFFFLANSSLFFN